MGNKAGIYLLASIFIMLLMFMPMALAYVGYSSPIKPYSLSSETGSFQCFRYPCFIIKHIGHGNMCEKIYPNGYVERFKCKKGK